MAINGGKILSYLELDTSRYTSAMAYAQQQAEQFAGQAEGWRNRLGALGRGMTQVGAALTVGVSTPLIGAGAAASKAAIEFESAFAGVRKTVDATEAEFGQLRATLLNMSKEIPQSASDLAGIMETAGQLGVDTANLESFTRTIADLGVATNLTGQEAATLLAQYANVTGMDLTNIDRLGSVIVALGNNTATTERDIANMAQRLSGMAQNLDLTDAQVMGLAATMASLGIEAELGGSAVSRTMARMQQAVLAGDKSLDAFARAAKVDAKTFAEAFKRDPIEALNLFVGGLGKTKAAGEDVYAVLDEVSLNDLRVTDSLLRLTGAGESLTNNINLANQAWTDNNALTAEASQRYATTESKLQLARNAVNRLLIALGDKLLPAVTNILEGVTDFVDGLGDLDEGMLQTAVSAGLFVAAIGPVLTLLGGLVSLFTGPLGLVAAIGLGGAALAAVANRLAEVKQAEIDAGLAHRFHGITLSATAMDAIIKAGFTAPNINVDKVNEAKNKIDAAAESVNTLQNKLTEGIFTVSLGATGDMSNLPQLAQDFVDGVQGYLDQQAYTCKLTVMSHFGADDPTGKRLRSEVTAYYNGLDAQAEAVGKKLRKAMDEAIADGVLDDEERKTISNLQAELQQILQEGSMIESKAAIRDLEYDIANTPVLDAQSYAEFLSRIQETKNQATADAQQIFDQTKDITMNLAVANAWDDATLDETMADVERRFGENMASIDQQTAMIQTKLANQVIGQYAGEIDKMISGMGEAAQQAWEQAKGFAEFYNLDLTQKQDLELFKFQFAENLKFSESDLYGLVPDSVRQQAQEQYKLLAPTYETLKQMRDTVAAAGGEVPQWITDALKPMEAMRLLSLTGYDLINEMAQGIETANPQVIASAKTAAEAAKSGASAEMAEFLSVGSDAGQGYCNGILAKVNAAADAAKQLALAAIRSAAKAQQSKSPSKITGKLGRDFGDGYINNIKARTLDAKLAGRRVAEAALSGIQEGQDSHSPAKASGKLGDDFSAGYVGSIENGAGLAASAADKMARETTLAGGMGTLKGIKAIQAARELAEAAAEEYRKKQAARRATAARAAAAAAEAARQEAVLREIVTGGERALAAENAAGAARMAQLAKQTAALMATIGATSIWYQDTTLDKELSQSNTYWQDAQDRAQAEYDALKARLEKSGTDAQREAAQTAHEERMAQLKQFAKDEAAALKEQYDTQKDIALRWLDTQQELMERELSAKREAANQEDYQAQLADLQKQLRQSKSAREQRELQAEIDRMERDEALRQEELQLQQITDGYAALREAINAGLIGLGDLTGDTALGSLSFGSAGLAALDNISATQLRAVLDSLSASAIPAKGSSAGNTYQIDLRGATVRDDGDIQRIVDEFEARMRSAGR